MGFLSLFFQVQFSDTYNKRHISSKLFSCPKKWFGKNGTEGFEFIITLIFLPNELSLQVNF